MKIASFDVISGLIEIGTNTEMADIDNPRGEIYGEAVYLRAIGEDGTARVLRVQMTVATAQRQAAALTARYFAHGKLPLCFDQWTEARPVYGSDAYQSYGADDDIAGGY